MAPIRRSGQATLKFTHCADLRVVPSRALAFEEHLHGGFADDTAASGYIYYGMPGCGIMRISADLTRQEIIELPSELTSINFHSTKIIEFDGKRRAQVLPSELDVKALGADGLHELPGRQLAR